MTTVNGTLQVCDDTQLPSLQLTCSGSSCQGLAKNWTCTQNQALWTCSNGISCSSNSNNFSTTFTLTQNNITFQANQVVFSHGYSYNVFEDPSGNVTITNRTTSSPTAKSAASYGRGSLPSWGTILSVLLLWSVWAVTPAAADCFLNPFTSLGQLSNAFVESVETGSWAPIQMEWCTEVETEVLGAQGFGEELEQKWIVACYEKMLVGEISAAAVGLLGRNIAVTIPLGDAALAGIFGAVAAPEVIGLGVLALAACPMLANCAGDQVRQNAASLLCSTTTTSVPSSGQSTASISQSTTSTSPPAPTASGQLAILSVADDNCASCLLSAYAIGIKGLAQTCGVAVPLGVAYDVSTALCDSSFNGKYAAFCEMLCANQCATYNINDWIKSAGGSYMSNATLASCNSNCPGFKGDGRCGPYDTCGCGIGAKTCACL